MKRGPLQVWRCGPVLPDPRPHTPMRSGLLHPPVGGFPLRGSPGVHSPLHCPLCSPNCPLGLAPISRQCIASHRIARSRSPRRQPAATLFDGTDCFFDPDLICGPRDETDLLPTDHSPRNCWSATLYIAHSRTSPFFPIVLRGLATTTSSLIDNPKHPRFDFLWIIRMSRTSNPRSRILETTPILQRDC